MCARRVSRTFRRYRTLERNGQAVVLAPPPAANTPSIAHLAAISHWHGVGSRSQTLVLSESPMNAGFRASAGAAGPGVLGYPSSLVSGARSRLLGVGRAPGSWRESAPIRRERGALRTFARLPSDSDRLDLMADHAFRSYAAEISLHGSVRGAMDPGTPYGPDVRLRHPRDAWDIFSLYCACTPPLVRHAESRSLKEWSLTTERLPTLLRRRRPSREVVIGRNGQSSGVASVAARAMAPGAPTAGDSGRPRGGAAAAGNVAIRGRTFGTWT